MFKNFLLAALRNLWRNKVNSLISISSLMIGLAVFLFVFLYVKQELSYDRNWPDAERIHRVLVEYRGMPGTPDGRFPSIQGSAWPAVTEYFSEEIEVATRIAGVLARPVDSDNSATRFMALADSDFNDIFKLEVLAGSMEQVLGAPGYIALEEGYANSLGEIARLGESIRMVTVAGGEQEFIIAAIYRLPQNISSAVAFQQVSLINDYALPLFSSSSSSMKFSTWEDSVQIWLKLVPEITTGQFNALQPGFIEETDTVYKQVLGSDKAVSEHLLYHWQPLANMHFNPSTLDGGDAGDAARVVTFAVVGLLVLLAGCSNSVSLSLASAMERRREIGIRKAAGALQQDIMWQYLGEALLLVMLALIPALAWTNMLQPVLLQLAPETLSITPVTAGPEEYVWMLVIALLVGLASGIYPALVLSRVRPEAVLKVSSGGGIRKGKNIRNILVAVQFCFALMLLIGTSALYTQLAVTRSQPLGFNPENILLLSIGNMMQEANNTALMNALEQIPGVKQVGPASFPPNMNLPAGINTSDFIRKSGDSVEVKLQNIPATPAFISMMEIPLLAGRFFDPQRDTRDYIAGRYSDATSAVQSRIVINRAAARALGFDKLEDAVDQVIYRRNTNRQNGNVVEDPSIIIGVVEDSMFMSFSRRPEPENYTMLSSSQGSNFFLKYEQEAEATIKKKIQEVATAINGAPLQDIVFIEDRVARAFIREKKESRFLLICGDLVLLLACIGLYGLAAFSIERKIKEVGVRKALGSGAGSIVSLFLWSFSKPVLLASVVAVPVAIYFVLQWIEKFPYQLEKIWLLPLSMGAVLLVLAIALLTVSVITARSALMKPVQSLRYE